MGMDGTGEVEFPTLLHGIILGMSREETWDDRDK